MNTYVKIHCKTQGDYPNWFLVYDGKFDLVDDLKLNEEYQEKRIRLVFNLHNHRDIDSDIDYDKEYQEQIKTLISKPVNYRAKFNKYGTLYIRENGTFLTLSDKENIIDTVYSNHFPVKETADIVICENDKEAEKKWINFLQKTYLGKTIKTINFFDLRNDSDIKANFADAELITFSTTFSNFEWFEKLIENKYAYQKVIGYSHQPEKWKEAKQIYSDVEIVHSI